MGDQGWLQDGSKDANEDAGVEEGLPRTPHPRHLPTCWLGLQAEECVTAGSKMQVVLHVWRCPFWQRGQRGAACLQPCLPRQQRPPPSCGSAAAQGGCQHSSPHPAMAARWIRGGNVVTAEFGEEELTSKENRR